MAAEAVAGSTPGGFDRPYGRSWLDLLFSWITAVPGPTWLTYLVLVLPSIAFSNSALWLSGLRPWGDLHPAQVYWGTTTVAMFAAAHYLRNVAGASFDRFRPALGNGGTDPDRDWYELTVMPMWPIAILTVAVVATTPLYYISDPVAFQIVGLTGAGLLARALTEGLTSAVFIAVAFQAVRQLRIVTRLHAEAQAVDPFRPLPLYAFSRLSALVGIVLVVFISGGALVNPVVLESVSAAWLWVPWLLGTPVVAAVIFVVPMLGMHRRLVDVKIRLETAADGRMETLLNELNEAIDARASERVDAIDRTISALRHQREILARLPTWPWSTATIRGFGSALLLPIALFLVQRYIGEFLG